MLLLNPKLKKGTEKIIKYQFETQEEAENFVQASPHTQIYKIEFLEDNKKSHKKIMTLFVFLSNLDKFRKNSNF